MKYRIPDRNEPGYLRRQGKRIAFLSEENLDEKQSKMLEWLVDYVIDDDPMEVLLDASEEEIDTLMKAIAEASKPNPKEKES